MVPLSVKGAVSVTAPNSSMDDVGGRVTPGVTNDNDPANANPGPVTPLTVTDPIASFSSPSVLMGPLWNTVVFRLTMSPGWHPGAHVTAGRRNLCNHRIEIVESA